MTLGPIVQFFWPTCITAFVFQLLLEHGGNPNVPDVTYKNTALHYACLGGHFECVETLLKAGKWGLWNSLFRIKILLIISD